MFSKIKGKINITNLIRLIMVCTFVISLIRGIIEIANKGTDPFSYFVTALTALAMLAISGIPSFLNQRDILAVPTVIQTIFTVFTFLAMFLGDINGFYNRFWWWDSLLHLFSGAMFTFVGYLLFCSLNRDVSIRNKLNPISVVLFAFCFSLACELVWELFEFAADTIIGTNMQRWQSDFTVDEWLRLQNTSNLSNPGLIDTMKDITNNTISSLGASVYVYFSTVRGNSKYVKPPITTKEIVMEWNKR